MDSVPAQQSQQAGQHPSMQRSASLDKLKRSLSMPDQITRDIAKPLLASAFDEVLSDCETYTLIHVPPAACHAVLRIQCLLEACAADGASQTCMCCNNSLPDVEGAVLLAHHCAGIEVLPPVACPLTTEYTASSASWCQSTHCYHDPYVTARLERLVNTGCRGLAPSMRPGTESCSVRPC